MLTASPAETESQRQNLRIDPGVPCVVIAKLGIELGVTLFESVGESRADVYADPIRASRFENRRRLNQAVRAYNAPPHVARQTHRANGDRGPGELPGTVIPTHAADAISPKM